MTANAPSGASPSPAFVIRTATMADLDAIAAVEAASFPPAEACLRASFAERLAAYPQHFWLLETNGQLASFVNGMTTDERTLRDEMFSDARLHNEQGAWQMIFGVATTPEFRRRGYAEAVLNRVIADTRTQGRQGLVLTCKDKLISYYEKFGFVNEGVSGSEHGGATWYDMRLVF